MPYTLRTTLCETRDALRILRRVVNAREHIDGMWEIDCLIGLAEDKVARAIVLIDAAPVLMNEPDSLPEMTHREGGGAG